MNTQLSHYEVEAAAYIIMETLVRINQLSRPFTFTGLYHSNNFGDMVTVSACVCVCITR